jgi:hypothetical protein
MLTPLQAMQQAAQGETGRDFASGGWVFNPAFPEILSGQINATAFSPTCAGGTAPNVNLFQTASGLALGTVSAGVGILAAPSIGIITGAMIPGIGIAIAAVGAVVAIVDAIFAHHSAAAKREQALGCAAIAAANNTFSLIDQAVRNGQMTPAAASAGLDDLVAKVAAYMAPSIGHNPCNADCEVLVQVKAIAIYRKSQYADMPAPVSLVSSPAGVSTTAPASSLAGAPLVPAALLAQGAFVAPSAGYGPLLALLAIGFGLYLAMQGKL